MIPRLQEKYKKTVVPALTKQFEYKNVMSVPRLEKIVINMGLGKRAVVDSKIIDFAAGELSKITGQKAVTTKSKKAISNFKIREGLEIGCKVTLRSARMYEFFDRLCAIALPRVRDFRGIPTKGFDQKGNYTLGVKDHTIFPEIVFDKGETPVGMNITFVTSAKNNEEGRELLTQLGLPFRKKS